MSKNKPTTGSANMASRGQHQISIYVDAGTLAKINRIADKEKRSRANVVKCMVLEVLNKGKN